MSGFGVMDKGIEQLEEGFSQVKQQLKKAPSDVAGAVMSQVTGKSAKSGDGSVPNAAREQEAAQQQAGHESARQANEQMVKELYAPSMAKGDGLSDGEGKEQTASQKAASEFIQGKMEDGMSADEAQKLYSLRKKLHQEYYQKLTSYEQSRPEERTAEKVEKEKEQDDRMNLEKQQKKDAPIAVQMGANRTEKFPGASG